MRNLGDRITIRSGPYVGLEGTVTEVTTAHVLGTDKVAPAYEVDIDGKPKWNIIVFESELREFNHG